MKIEYAVTQIDRVSKNESLVSVSITPEERFNGFSGATIQFQVNTANKQHEILERVKWKVAQEVGLSKVEFVERSGQ